MEIGSMACCQDNRKPHLFAIILISFVFLFLPFINKPVSVDSDMMIHTSKMLMINLYNPPLGEYGRHMAVYNIHTGMPSNSIYFRCPHPPLIPLLISPVLKFSKDILWPVHVFMLFFNILCVLGFYLLVTHISPLIRNKATLLFLISPAFVVNGQNIMWDIPNAAFIFWALSMIISGVKKNSIVFITIAGMFTGLAALTKMSCFPLYLAIPVYLLLNKKYKFILCWAILAFLFPLVWIAQNLVVFGKIQYLNTSHVNLYLPDIRYHFERYASMMGVCMIAPLWVLWLLIRNKNCRITLFSCMIPVLVISSILFIAHKLTLIESVAFFILALTGCVLVLCTFVMFINDRKSREQFYISLFIMIFFIVYSGLILIHPAAEVRFLVPIIAFCIIWFCNESQSISGMESRIFWISLFTFQIIVTLSLCYADYTFVDSDRKFATWLHDRYPSDRTWYFGRLSYDYYLHENGCRFLGLDGHPKCGDFLVHEKLPESYLPTKMIPDSLFAVPVDSIEFSRYMLRTMPPGGGFYGDSRLPFTIKLNTPQKKFVVYILNGK
jgi:hypothetical protein